MRYAAETDRINGFEVVTLNNELLTAKIAVNLGNTLFSLRQDEKEALYFPYSLEAYKTNSKLAGNPFMHPWANRLEAEYMDVDNQKHHFPEEQLSLLYRDGNNLPLHGLLLKSDQWKTIELYEGKDSCHHLAELVFDSAAWLSVFPFKHTIRIKHELRDRELRIETVILNEEGKEMPVSFGFHPYFSRTKTDVPLTVPAENYIEVNDVMIPIGSVAPKEKRWNFRADKISLSEAAFDDGFQDLKFENNKAMFLLEDINVIFGENYPFAQVYAPAHPDKPYVCIEPMTAATNALNTNGCKKIKPGEKYMAIFSIVL